MDRLRFQSFGSGSSGNCYFIGNASCGLLIDAGIGIRNIRKYLRNMGLDFQYLHGVFVTHDHADHIKAVGTIGEKHHVPIYSTRKVHEGIERSYCVTEKLLSSKKYIEKDETLLIGDFKITAFHVSHDATDCVGYTIEYKEKRFTFATDVGYINPEVAFHLEKADYMVLEANYDVKMLAEGQYPYHLKKRITAKTGHLSNVEAASFLADKYSDKLQHVFLCHLSRENNSPEVAFETVNKHLADKQIVIGKDLEVVTLERFCPSKMYIF